MKGIFSIVRWSLWQRRWFIFWWVIGIAVFIALNLSVYPSFKDQAAELDKSYSQLPDTVKSLFTDTGEFLSPVGYLSSQIFYLLLPMLFGILGIGMGASLIAKEEQQRTIELLLSRPLSRGGFLLGKALTALVILVVTGITTLLVTVLGVWWAGFEGVALSDVALATLMALILGGLFSAIAFTLTAIGHGARLASIGIASLFALGGYIIASLDKTVAWLQWPAKALPYHYYHPGAILRGEFTGKEALGFVIVTGVLVLIAWIVFRRRDIE